MIDPWRYECPVCGSRQVFRGRKGWKCYYNNCQFEEPIDLKRNV